ncbi:CPBP family intramembrane glutamic endopeptidase [Lactobacillus sp. CBA3605]|uniref:CPBP family intramembrane glutamic endopeptidase n=1 Tax=Lactobacillus sp. CBA3605 TaxID=2099788 RepID=UPI001319C760|nr:type II CAAX endopeptidase family protein [Lactobacillus sp. CBA3605]
MNKIIRKDNLPKAALDFIVSMLLYTLGQLPLLINNSWRSSMITISLTFLELMLGGLVIVMIWKIYMTAGYSHHNKWPIKTYLYNVIIGYLSLNTINLSLGAFQSKITENQQTVITGLHSSSLPLYFIWLVFMAPIIEELIFRGILMDFCFKKQAIISASMTSGIVFGLFHGYSNLAGLLTYSGMGLVFALFYRWTGKLSVVILIHGLNNLIVFFEIYLLPDFEPSLLWLLTINISLIIGLIVLKNSYHHYHNVKTNF